jgi:response regulator RpfG family c-di-GMP phosphodiesterase
MTARVLLVDDEVNVLEGFRRHLRKQFDLETACGGEAALDAVRRDPPAVVVSDMRMPGMDGIAVLQQIAKIAPTTVRMMLTGNADLDTAVRAVNEGCIFRFLSKPCRPEALAQSLADGIEQHRLITAEKTLIQRTLRGAICMITDLLELSAPESAGRGKRMQKLSHAVAERIGMPNPWKVELAALFAQAGHITLPPDVLKRINAGKGASPRDAEMRARSLQVSSQLVGHIPRLEGVARILTVLERDGVDTTLPEDERIGAAILRAIDAFDRSAARGVPAATTLAQMRSDGAFDPAIIEALAESVDAQTGMKPMRIHVRDLTMGMIFDQDVMTRNGQLLVGRGQEATPALRERLRNFVATGNLEREVSVLSPVQKACTVGV